MLRISHIEHKKNEEVLNTMKTKRSLIDSIWKKRAKYFGHMVKQIGYRDFYYKGKHMGKREREGQGLHGQIASRTGKARIMANR